MYLFLDKSSVSPIASFKHHLLFCGGMVLMGTEPEDIILYMSRDAHHQYAL